nr:MAG TPA: hypothetical protein [Caudoviricetes sp.]
MRVTACSASSALCMARFSISWVSLRMSTSLYIITMSSLLGQSLAAMSHAWRRAHQRIFITLSRISLIFALLFFLGVIAGAVFSLGCEDGHGFVVLFLDGGLGQFADPVSQLAAAIGSKQRRGSSPQQKREQGVHGRHLLTGAGRGSHGHARHHVSTDPRRAQLVQALEVASRGRGHDEVQAVPAAHVAGDLAELEVITATAVHIAVGRGAVSHDDLFRCARIDLDAARAASDAQVEAAAFRQRVAGGERGRISRGVQGDPRHREYRDGIAAVAHVKPPAEQLRIKTAAAMQQGRRPSSGGGIRSGYTVVGQQEPGKAP